MGYDLHITRARYWFESEEQPILLDQWRRYIENDPEMKIGIQDENELDASWYGEKGNFENSEIKESFWWYKGRIMTKNPGKDGIRKMFQIADSLNARLVGDNDEEFRIDGEIWEYEYVDKPPGLFQRLCAWWTGNPLPERKSDWVSTGKWDK